MEDVSIGSRSQSFPFVISDGGERQDGEGRWKGIGKHTGDSLNILQIIRGTILQQQCHRSRSTRPCNIEWGSSSDTHELRGGHCELDGVGYRAGCGAEEES